MEDPDAAPDRRSITPAIVASAVFTAACAVFAVAFVSARGGLELPRLSSPPVAVASPASGPATAVPGPSATAAPSAPSATSAPPTPPPTPAPTPAPTALPTPYAAPTLQPGDPLLALDPCPGFPGCYEYTVVRGDSLSGIISRYLLDFDVLAALDPGRYANRDLVVVGETLYLGRDPLARLEPCPDGAPCVLYEVRRGETLTAIARRYLMTRAAILEANPGLATPVTGGEVIRLPRLPAPA